MFAYVFAALSMLLVACGGDVKEVPPTQAVQQGVSATSAPRTAPAAATAVSPSPTPIPPTPIPPKVIGQPVVLTSERDGTKYSVTVNSYRDPVVSTNQFNNPQGRFVLIDWTVRNDGEKNVDFSALSLKLLTVDDFEIDRGNFAGFSGPELASFPTLGPGQAVRGFRVYDVPKGAVLKAAIYHPSGSPQFVIANLP